jgi:excisionase family DNA binding protein
MVISSHLLTPKETAEYLGISMPRIYTLLRSKGFPGLRIGKHWRVEPVRLQKWIEEHMSE